MARSHGYQCQIVMPDDVAKEKSDLIECYGATVRRVKSAAIVNDINELHDQDTTTTLSLTSSSSLFTSRTTAAPIHNLSTLQQYQMAVAAAPVRHAFIFFTTLTMSVHQRMVQGDVSWHTEPKEQLPEEQVLAWLHRDFPEKDVCALAVAELLLALVEARVEP